MSLGKARVIRGPRVAAAKPLVASWPIVTEQRARRVTRDELAGREEAARIVQAAREEAAGIRARANAEAADSIAKAKEEAREAEHVKLAALYLALRAEQEQRAERDLDRAVTLAKLLAERLLGHALEQDETLVASLARQALAEVRGARQVAIDAHPLDAGALEQHLLSVGFDANAIEIRHHEGLSRGSLLVHTNLGTLDAKLTPQLDRLAKALRDALQPG